jgi:hypothetical protein
MLSFNWLPFHWVNMLDNWFRRWQMQGFGSVLGGSRWLIQWVSATHFNFDRVRFSMFLDSSIIPVILVCFFNYDLWFTLALLAMGLNWSFFKSWAMVFDDSEFVYIVRVQVCLPIYTLLFPSKIHWETVIHSLCIETYIYITLLVVVV